MALSVPLSVHLTFRGGQSLKKKTNLILTFDNQSMTGMYSVYNPVAWKCVNSACAMSTWILTSKFVSRVTAFPAKGKQTPPVLYSRPTEEHRHHGQAVDRSKLHTLQSKYLSAYLFQELANPSRGLGT